MRKYPRGTIVLVGLAAATITAIGVSGLRGILAPTLLTLVLTICAAPVRRGLTARGVPGGLATGVVILTVFATLAGFIYAVLIALTQFSEMLPTYSGDFAAIGVSIAQWLERIGIGQAQIQSIVQGLDPSTIVNSMANALGGVANLAGALVIVLTMTILMAADAVYSHAILNQLGARKPNLVVALGQYASNVRRYMIVTTVLGVAQGTLNAIALALLGVPAPLLWGVLAFLCSFIPNVGYFLALIPPLLFGLLEGGWPTAIAVLIVYAVINAVVQSIVQPRIVGHAVSLSQTITFFSVLFWALIIGPVGAILAIPLTLLAKAVLIDADPDAHWWRPALGPTAETREILTEEATEARMNRKARRAGTAKIESIEPDLPNDPTPPASEGSNK